jgi:hypothetical protein
MKIDLKSVLVAAAVITGGSLGLSTFGREKWPQMPAAEKQQQETWKQHQQEVVSNIQPALVEWAKRGKPFIPWAAQPGDLPQASVPAFPGAEGGGKFSFGGRGGKVYVVTSLDDSGPGTLREGCEAAGPRIIVFNVAGIIHLKMPVFIEAPYLTIAGQTAPGDGICIAGQSVMDDAHDVVIRYIRFRRGNSDIFDRQSGLAGSPVGNIIIDHCSASWGNDQTLDTYRHMYQPPGGGPALKLPCVNDTIQWCLVSEGLNVNNHAFGGDWGGRNTGFHHNLLASNTGRNPSIAMSYDFNFVNNVLFNWRHRSLDGGDQHSLFNVISNYYKPGPATLDNPVRYRIIEPSQSWSKTNPVSHWGKAYVAGNIVAGYPKVTANNWDGGVQFNKSPDPDASGDIAKGLIDDPVLIKQIVAEVRVDHPFPMAPITMQTAREACDSVLADAGDTLPRRDAVDQRVVESVRTGKVWAAGQLITPPPMKGLAKNNIGTAGNGIITDPSQVGGYPNYQGQPFKDLGADGIPLWWKQKFNLDPNDPALAAKDLQGDGYTVMDKYLDGLDPTRKVDWTNPQSNLNTLTPGNFITSR